MCGIAGYWDPSGADVSVARKMADQLEHRGPDDSGVWLSNDKRLAMSHRRLSIIDVSDAGHQPMISDCGRYVLVYNGEIYNHLSLRKELDEEGHKINWKGHSDTETLLITLCAWGIEKTLLKLNGMFAFSFFDSVTQTMFLARDRMGEKPLYYGVNNGAFLFGSELKSFTSHPRWNGQVNRNVLALYMRHNYVPAPWSIYDGIYKLPPAHFVVITNCGKSVSDPKCYWNLAEIASSGPEDCGANTETLIDELDTLLRDSIRLRMLSDVPLGAFLSGGIDSSTVAALMQAQSTSPIKTFTIGFHEKGHNEATHAKAVAKHLGTDHTELYVSPEEAMAVIPKLSEIWDEPFSDSSQIPTLLVSKLAKESVTVSLSGDGGDELFCGYTRYTQGYQMWSKLKVLPMPVRRLVSLLIRALPGMSIEQILKFLPQSMRIPHLADRLPKLADVVGKGVTGESYYLQLISHWKDPTSIVLNSVEPPTAFTQTEQSQKILGFRERMMYLDSVTYLPDDILTKVDRASMAVSLEARVPMLDHRVVEFSHRIPMSLKYKSGQGKWLLRQVLQRYVPRELTDRPKMGFGVPIERWLRGPLRDWAETLLDERRLVEEGYFDPVIVRKMWKEHVSGKRRWHYYLWDVLMFQSWLDGNSHTS